MQERRPEGQSQQRQEIIYLLAPNSIAEIIVNNIAARNAYGRPHSFFAYSGRFAESHRIKLHEVDEALKKLLTVGLLRWVPGEDRYIRPDLFLLDESA